jgi:DNA-binding NtrC family response regulator
LDLSSELENKKILLIDDDEAIRSSMNFYFGAMGWHILSVGTAEEGLDALNEGPFDIIICDYRLPGMNGIELFRIASTAYPQSLRLLITAYATIELASEATGAGVHDIIQKPLSVESIEESIERLLGKA